VPGGAGMCRLPDGTVGFVEGAFPGETVKPLASVKKKDFARVTRFELVDASSERVEPACPVVDACGGCDWMKLERTAELRYKASLVAEALERTGGVRLSAPPEVITAGGELAYRSRVRLHVDARGRVGFYARGTHALVEVPGCPVAEPEVERGIRLVRDVAARVPLALRGFESVEVRAHEDGGLDFVAHPRAGAAKDVESGAERLRKELGGHGTVAVSRAGAEFSQVNRAVNAVLVARLVAGASERGVRTFLDLYAGSGNFAVPLALAGMTGVCVESEPRAAEHARARARHEVPDRLEVRSGDVVRALDALLRVDQRFELVVLDPPRAGAKDAVPGIVRLEPRVIAYVACDPVTLARDLRVLVEKGWAVASVTCFDMFPRTHHVETLVWLERPESHGSPA
jgi:23S rRNA (uracil1939-C5)-methyltransferase